MKRLSIALFSLQAAVSAAQPLTLDDCRRMALAEDRNLRNASVQVGAARDELQAFKANRLPAISLTGDYFYSGGKSSFTLPGGYLPIYVPNPETGALEPDILTTGPDGTPVFKQYAYMPDTKFDLKTGSVFSAGLSTGQPLYLGGKLRASVRMAAIAATMADLHVRETEAEVLVGVDEAFFACIRGEEHVKSTESYREVLAEFYRQMEQGHQAGMKSRNDLLKVQVQLNDAELQLRQAQNAMRLARMNLCYRIGLPLNTEHLDLQDDSVSAGTLSARSGDISNRPEYAMLEQQIAWKKEQVTLVRSDFLPQVSAMISYSYTHGIQLNDKALFSEPSFMGAVSVRIPIFHWGEGRRKVSAARREVEIASNRFEDLTRQMRLELMQSVNEYDESLLEVELTRQSVEQAEENRMESGNRYRAGMETLADYLQAQALWQQAQAELVEARARQRISYAKYLRAAGLSSLER